jgi:hypothetical protein
MTFLGLLRCEFQDKQVVQELQVSIKAIVVEGVSSPVMFVCLFKSKAQPGTCYGSTDRVPCLATLRFA